MIISVGMISEGTNISRLQVCCHLTNIKTEMHFRLILGRILRMTNSTNQEAIMYMLAEPKLLEYAYRVKQDVPFEADVVKFEKMKAVVDDDSEKDEKSNITFDKTRNFDSRVGIELGGFENIVTSDVFEEVREIADEHYLTTSYDKVVNIFGQFKQKAIALGLSELR
ncbi:hypothetical protein L3081_22240 [Colwellia sp. MSW7]|uniref:Helicase C-terminal domain-containing protein n=1 Tax=Colwellia maritima TaxID=2912588 RepID=A0ABS9X5W2_9GAMM|nr:hypothetical protein [Colwellia maritima]MCI2285606.1 hypothetical protein [Colwellia maritima]